MFHFVENLRQSVSGLIGSASATSGQSGIPFEGARDLPMHHNQNGGWWNRQGIREGILRLEAPATEPVPGAYVAATYLGITLVNICHAVS